MQWAREPPSYRQRPGCRRCGHWPASLTTPMSPQQILVASRRSSCPWARTDGPAFRCCRCGYPSGSGRSVTFAGDDLEVGVLAVLVDKRLEHEEPWERPSGPATISPPSAATIGLPSRGFGRILDQVVQEVRGCPGPVMEQPQNTGVTGSGCCMASPDTGVAQLLRGEGLFHEEFLHELFVWSPPPASLMRVHGTAPNWSAASAVRASSILLPSAFCGRATDHIHQAQHLLPRDNGEGQGNHALRRMYRGGRRKTWQDNRHVPHPAWKYRTWREDLRRPGRPSPFPCPQRCRPWR